jgi:hypothetical protein
VRWKRCGGNGADGGDGEGGLCVAPEVDTLEILVSDPAKPEDEEVLDEDDRSDRTMSAFCRFDLPGDVCRGARVAEGLGDSFFLRG